MVALRLYAFPPCLFSWKALIDSSLFYWVEEDTGYWNDKAEGTEALEVTPKMISAARLTLKTGLRAVLRRWLLIKMDNFLAEHINPSSPWLQRFCWTIHWPLSYSWLRLLTRSSRPREVLIMDAGRIWNAIPGNYIQKEKSVRSLRFWYGCIPRTQRGPLETYYRAKRLLRGM